MTPNPRLFRNPLPRSDQFIRIFSHVAVLLGVLAGLSAPGLHHPSLVTVLLCFVLMIEMPERLHRWTFLPAVAGLLAMAIGLDLEPDELSVFSYLFHIVTAAAATRQRWPGAIGLTGVAFLLMFGAQRGWFLGGEAPGTSHALTDLGGLLFTTVLIKELLDGQRRIFHMNTRLERQANTDDLTGLLNHRALMQRFDDLVLLGVHPFAVIMFDLDSFKQFNDRFGHQAGDEVLRHVGRELLLAAPEGAAAGRYGGDEFMVLIPGADRERATAWASELVTALAARSVALPGGRSVSVGASYGVAVSQEDGLTRQELHAKADVNLYRSKAKRSQSACGTAG